MPPQSKVDPALAAFANRRVAGGGGGGGAGSSNLSLSTRDATARGNWLCAYDSGTMLTGSRANPTEKRVGWACVSPDADAFGADGKAVARSSQASAYRETTSGTARGTKTTTDLQVLGGHYDTVPAGTGGRREFSSVEGYLVDSYRETSGPAGTTSSRTTAGFFGAQQTPASGTDPATLAVDAHLLGQKETYRNSKGSGEIEAQVGGLRGRAESRQYGDHTYTKADAELFALGVNAKDRQGDLSSEAEVRFEGVKSQLDDYDRDGTIDTVRVEAALLSANAKIQDSNVGGISSDTRLLYAEMKGGATVGHGFGGRLEGEAGLAKSTVAGWSVQDVCLTCIVGKWLAKRFPWLSFLNRETPPPDENNPTVKVEVEAKLGTASAGKYDLLAGDDGRRVGFAAQFESPELSAGQVNAEVTRTIRIPFTDWNIQARGGGDVSGGDVKLPEGRVAAFYDKVEQRAHVGIGGGASVLIVGAALDLDLSIGKRYTETPESDK